MISKRKTCQLKKLIPNPNPNPEKNMSKLASATVEMILSLLIYSAIETL